MEVPNSSRPYFSFLLSAQKSDNMFWVVLQLVHGLIYDEIMDQVALPDVILYCACCRIPFIYNTLEASRLH